MIKVSLIDPQQIFREGMKQLLESEAKFEIVYSNDTFVVEQITERIPYIDLFLFDINTTKKYQHFIKENILDCYPDKKVVVLSSKLDNNHVVDAMLIGAHGYLLKEMSYESFTEAIHAIFEDGIYIHPYVTKELVSDYRNLYRLNGVNGYSYEVNQSDDLCTKREYEILQLLVDGKSNLEIAEILNISEKTVKNHISNIFRKINVKDRTQAVVMAIRNRWVRL